MKRTIVTTTLLAFALSAGTPLFAAEKTHTQKSPEETCKALAHKEHITKDKLDAYMKNCVEKHAQTSTMHNPTSTHSQPSGE